MEGNKSNTGKQRNKGSRIKLKDQQKDSCHEDAKIAHAFNGQFPWGTAQSDGQPNQYT